MKRMLLFAVLLFSLKGAAQSPMLFGHNWYLQRLEIGEQVYVYPLQGIISTIDFTEIDDTNLFTIDFPNCYGTQNYLITYAGETGFSLPGLIGGFDFECPAIPPDVYGRHYGFYWQMLEPIDLGPFTYVVSNENDHDFLVVTNINGDKAFYADAQLATDEFDSTQIVVFFNTDSDLLEIKNVDSKLRVTIYDQAGQAVLSDVQIKDGVNLGALPHGIYFAQLTLDGKTISKKFLKY